MAQKQNFFSTFAEHFRATCDEILQLQKNAAVSAVSHIEYTMLYTNFASRRYVATIMVYGKDRYCDKNQRMVGEYDISPLFVYFNELWEKLLSERRRYGGSVSAKDVNSCMVKALPSFYSYLFCIARFATRDSVHEKPFTDIAKNDVFRLSVGDYMVKNEPVYVRSTNKDAATIAAWFEGLYPYDYSFLDSEELDFSGCSFVTGKLKHVQFNKSILTESIFDNATLRGANFRGAQMGKSRLDFATIHEADFSHADLKDASLRSVRGGSGLSNPKKWQHVGYHPVSFRNADLTNVDFCSAYLRGADFRGAILSDVNFTDAVLDDAVFSTTELSLSDEQKTKIIVDTFPA
ncbi:MAG: pentapeptide repeat-containing protein [Oscillospiraceae bacterium]|nr:pentapeptide repeat-containing protein [Oscillospiraceae bacterium]